MSDIQAAKLNERIARLEEENAQLKNDLAEMTLCAQEFKDAQIDYSDRLIKVLTL